MRKVVSKQVEARYPGGGLLQDHYFKEIREKTPFFGNDSYSQEEDTGINRTKKTVVPQTGFGSRWRENNPGAGQSVEEQDEESPSRGVGSGYNDGGPADDETGPGNTSIIPNPYEAVEKNTLFMDLKLKGEGYDESISGHMKKLKQGPRAILPHKRYPVN